MKRFFNLVLLISAVPSFAQTESYVPPRNGFHDIQAVRQYIDTTFSDSVSYSVYDHMPYFNDDEFLRYKRAENYWSGHVMPDGTFPDMREQHEAYKMCKQSPTQQTASSTQWINISQTSATGGYNGMGRVTAIAFHPTDPNTFYVGAPIGGIWKTTDGGTTYSPLGDDLPYVSVGNILVDQQDPNNIYITIGDHIGWWNYGLGVYKSIDGGATWNATTDISQFVNGVAYYNMAMSPVSSDTILVAQSNGLYRTADGGVTWAMVHGGAHRDVKFKPGNGSIVYASTDDYWGSSEVYRSLDGGLTWNVITAFATTANTIRLTTTLVDPDRLGISCNHNSIIEYYVSTDQGASYQFRSNMPYADMLLMSQLDTNYVYCGGIDISRSTNGGTTWSQLTSWWNDGIHPEVHADQHYAAFSPLTQKIFFCNDGGVYRNTESSLVFTELDNGLIITQFYKIAVSQSNPVFMIGGTQDNGGRMRIAPGIWDATNGGDAMENAIDETNDQTIYTTYVSGLLYRSLDQWNFDTYNNITPSGSNGAWVTPYVLVPGNQQAIVAGYQDVYYSPDRGTTWTTLSTNLTGASNNTLACIAVSAVDNNVIYASRGNTFYATQNFGTSWSSHFVPVGNANFTALTSISVYPGTNDTIFATAGGYTNTKKVYRSTNGGANWMNISGALPNVPVNVGIFDRYSPYHDYYIGTDIGVFFINDTNSTWTYYGNGLPNTSVTDMDIQYSTGKLRVATFGRGIWETDVISVINGLVTHQPVLAGANFSLAINPVHDALMLNAMITMDDAAVLEIYNLAGQLMTLEDRHVPEGNYQLNMDITSLPAGLYFVRAQTNKGTPQVFRFVKE